MATGRGAPVGRNADPVDLLMIEDDPLHARLVELYLSQDDTVYRIVRARRMDEARLHLSDGRFDVILLDLGLPGSSGLETLDLAIAAADGTPVLVVTGFGDRDTETEALRRGAADYLVKGHFEDSELIRAIRHARFRHEAAGAGDRIGDVFMDCFDAWPDYLLLVQPLNDGQGNIPDFRIEALNRAAAACLAVSTDAVRGRLLTEVWPALRATRLLDRFRSAALLEKPGRIESRLPPLPPRADSVSLPEIEWVDWRMAPVGEKLLIRFADISERRALTEALERATAEAAFAADAKRETLESILHRLQGPVAAVRAALDGLRDTGTRQPALTDAAVSGLAEAAERLSADLQAVGDASYVETLARREFAYRQMIDAVPDLTLVIAEGRIGFANAAAAGILGFADAADLVGKSLETVFDPAYDFWTREDCRELVRAGGYVTIGFRKADESQIELEAAAAPVITPNRGDAVLIIGRDVSELRRTSRSISACEERLRKIMATMLDGVITIGADGTIESFNPAAESIFGYRAQEVVGHNVRILMPEPDAGRHDEYIKRFCATGRARVVGASREVTGRRKDGSQFPLEIALSEFPEGGQRIFIGVLRDISERKQAEEHLRFLATRDPLTGLPNRTLFSDRLEEAIDRAKDNASQFAVLFVDLDDFKKINDTMGHTIGDQMLQETAKRLLVSVRSNDTVARFSGDKFMVILNGISDPGYAEKVASDMLAAVAAPFRIDRRQLYTTASIGLVTYPDGAETFSDLMRDVDTAVHHAKAQGRNTYQVFTRALGQAVERRLRIENALRGALGGNEFSLVYQPKVALGSGRLIGVEALLRWDSGALGRVGPAEFVSVAEETGLIVDIGAWVLRQACRQISLWTSAGLPPIHVAVNLSARQFQDQGLLRNVQRVLDDSDLDPRLIELELTESMLVDDAEDSVRILHQLKRLGISLAIDDFGTGYSSLSYLKRFPIDALKIDRAFIKDIPDNRDDVAIIRAMIGMAHSLDLSLVAEGVETEAQLAFLRDLDCQVGQGYYFSKPLDPDSFAAWYRDGEFAGLDRATHSAAAVGGALVRAPAPAPLSGTA